MQRELALFWTAVLMVLPALAIGRAWRKSRETTLAAPLMWSLLGYVVVSVAVVWKQVIGATVSENWTYVAATTLLCPIVALFGAKRPQSSAWQLIVVSFWIVAALPAFQSLVVRPGEGLDLHSVWKWFLAVLILTGGANYLPTRFGFAAALVTAGQGLLLWNYLPKFAPTTNGFEPALGLLVVMVGIGAGFAKQRRTARRCKQYHGWNRVWLDFRDFYGVAWALRIMERVNSQSPGREAGVRLYWDGFYELRSATETELQIGVTGDAVMLVGNGGQEGATEIRPASPQSIEPLDPLMRSLLRRFVSNEWLDSRLRQPPRQ